MRSLKDLLLDWKAAHQANKELAKILPRVIGVIAVKTMRENFDKQGFDDGNGVNKWKPRSKRSNRKYDTHPHYKGTVYSSKNPILKQTGNLYRAIRYRASSKSVAIGVNLNIIDYAKLMQEGGDSIWLGDPIKIPPRKYLGYSKKLDTLIKNDITKRYNILFKKFRP